MARNREEDEMIGSIPEHGEDPRFADGEGVIVSSNGAFSEIEDFDHFDPVDVDQDPHLPQVVDNDGDPDQRLFAEASEAFEQGGTEHDEALDTQKSDAAGDEVLGDEFVERLRRREAASVDELGRPVSDLAHLAQLDEIEHREANKLARPVQINPESAYTAMLGGSAPIKIGGPNVEVARWTGNSQVEACPITIGLGEVSPTGAAVDIPAGPFFTPVFRPFAIIQYGTRNSVISFEVDIGLGTQFTIGASAVNVIVGLEDTSTVGEMRLAGQLSFYTVTRTTPVTRTLYYDTNGVSLSHKFAVAKFAKSVTVWRKISTQALTIGFKRSNNTIAYTVTLAAGAFMTDPIPLSGEIFFIDVSAGLAVLDDTSLIFELNV